MGKEDDETLEQKLTGFKAKTTGSVSTASDIPVDVTNSGNVYESIDGEHGRQGQVYENGAYVRDENVPNSTQEAAAANAVYSKRKTWISAASSRNGGATLFAQQFLAMLWKRVLHTARNWVFTVCQLLIPAFFVAVALGLTKTLPKPQDSPPLKLNLEKFKDTGDFFSILGV